MDVLPHGGHPDGRRLGRVPGRVGQQVAQDLDDALPVRQHPRQVRRQVDAERIPAPSAQVHVSGLIHDGLELHGLGCDRQPARLDVRRVQQVADQATSSDTASRSGRASRSGSGRTAGMPRRAGARMSPQA